jgi:hypothetical protein
MRSKMSAWLDGNQHMYKGCYAVLASQMIERIRLDRPSRVGNTQCTGLAVSVLTPSRKPARLTLPGYAGIDGHALERKTP